MNSSSHGCQDKFVSSLSPLNRRRTNPRSFHISLDTIKLKRRKKDTDRDDWHVPAVLSVDDDEQHRSQKRRNIDEDLLTPKSSNDQFHWDLGNLFSRSADFPFQRNGVRSQFDSFFFSPSNVEQNERFLTVNKVDRTKKTTNCTPMRIEQKRFNRTGETSESKSTKSSCWKQDIGEKKKIREDRFKRRLVRLIEYWIDTLKDEIWKREEIDQQTGLLSRDGQRPQRTDKHYRIHTIEENSFAVVDRHRLQLNTRSFARWSIEPRLRLIQRQKEKRSNWFSPPEVRQSLKRLWERQ